MAYCSSCGEAVADTFRFCASCGQAVAVSSQTQVPAPGGQPLLGLDDVPAWLGWLVVPISLLTLGLGVTLYPFWAYRRGRRDGVGRAPTEVPYTGMGWKTVGWGLAVVVPVLGWYAAVHLTTLWYKHGLRVGAREDSASPRFTSLPALVAPLAAVSVMAFGMLAASLAETGQSSSQTQGGAQSSGIVPCSFGMACLPDELTPTPTAQTPAPRSPTPVPPTPAPSGPSLTGAEAAWKVENQLGSRFTELCVRQGGPGCLLVACEPEDFNDIVGIWSVRCVVWSQGSDQLTYTRYAVDDRTDAITHLGY